MVLRGWEGGTTPVFTQSITFQNVEIKIMGCVTTETTLDAILKFPQLIF